MVRAGAAGHDGRMPDTRTPDPPDRGPAGGRQTRPHRRHAPVAAGAADRPPDPPAAPAWLGAALDRPSLLLRLRVFARRRALDLELAAGADPAASAALALRARQLVAPTTRHALAVSLEVLVEEAARAPAHLALGIPLPRREIMAARPALLALAACLRAERPVYARGVALLSWLLAEGAGPAYNAHARTDLRDTLAAVADALDGGPAGAP
jgi:hypothetical protein